MKQKPTKRKGIADGIRTLPQMLIYFGIVRACRNVPAFALRRPIVLGLVIPSGQADLYTYVARLLIDRGRLSFGSDATVVTADPDPRRAKRNETNIAEAVRQHDRVVVLAESRDHLPARFELIADAVVAAPPVSARDVAAAVRVMFGFHMTSADAAIVAQAPIDVIAGAFRKGRPMTIAMKVMHKAMAAVSDDKAKPAVSAPTLDDLYGLGDAGDWGRELAIDLEDWKAGRIAWSDVERGILLSGVPGTGKTTFAAALARTCGVPLVAGSIARWQSNGHMGDLLKAMYGAFKEARDKSPSILFIDEIDAVGDRQKFSGDNAPYCTEVVNGLLECLDGADGREGVVIVGACNHPQLLDAAITRPGRLDRHVVIPLPDAEGRIGILRWHLKGALRNDDLSPIVERTEGWSGAALEQLVRQARRMARRARREMQLADLTEELPSLIPVPADTLWRAAIHEAGHAVVGLECGRWRVVDASVVLAMADAGARQAAGKVVWEDDGGLLSSATDYRARIMRGLGGLAAEEVVLGNRTDGGGGTAGSDLYNATLAAAAMEASMGLGSGLTYLSTVDPDELLRLLQFDHLTRSRVERTISDCYDEAKKIVAARRGDVERLAHALRDKGRLSGDEVRDVLDAQPRLKLVAGDTQ
jgi:SpoVK/Ycf46/Vps4 family AAA+-type ATPase